MRTKKQIKREYRELLRNVRAAEAEHNKVEETIELNGWRVSDYLYRRFHETWSAYLELQEKVWPLRCEFNRAWF